jgi:hypothetical protein
MSLSIWRRRARVQKTVMHLVGLPVGFLPPIRNHAHALVRDAPLANQFLKIAVGQTTRERDEAFFLRVVLGQIAIERQLELIDADVEKPPAVAKESAALCVTFALHLGEARDSVAGDAAHSDEPRG